jgi:septum formation protein
LEKNLDQKPVIVLASNSPRRNQIMKLGGWDFKVLPADIDESILAGEKARDYVLRMAGVKARAVSLKMAANSLVIGSDTTVVIFDGSGNEEILGKPSDDAEARTMLQMLRGKIHYVYTAVAVLNTINQRMISEVCETAVHMREYNQEEIEAYVASGDPMDKAGAYAVQNAVFHPVDSMHGCHPNVVGLPLCYVERILYQFGVESKHGQTRRCKPGESDPCKIYQKVILEETSGSI